LFTLWHVHESLLGELVLLEVSLVKLNARFKDWNELLMRDCFGIPKDIVTLDSTLLDGFTSSDLSEVENVELAVGDHLIGDLDEETSHSFVGVVVSGDGVDHLDTVHQSWKSFLNGLWGTIVEWLNEFLEGLKILDVIFSLIQRFSDSKLNASPLGGGEVDLGVWFVHLLILALR